MKSNVLVSMSLRVLNYIERASSQRLLVIVGAFILTILFFNYEQLLFDFTIFHNVVGIPIIFVVALCALELISRIINFSIRWICNLLTRYLKRRNIIKKIEKLPESQQVLFDICLRDEKDLKRIVNENFFLWPDDSPDPSVRDLYQNGLVTKNQDSKCSWPGVIPDYIWVELKARKEANTFPKKILYRVKRFIKWFLI